MLKECVPSKGQPSIYPLFADVFLASHRKMIQDAHLGQGVYRETLLEQ